MNTPEQSLIDNAEKLTGDGTLITRVSQSTTVPSPTAVLGGTHWHSGILFLVMPLGAIASLVYLLRGAPANILRQEFESLGAVVCALGYVAVFLRHVIRALAEDGRQAEVSGQVKTSLAPRTLSQTGPKPAPSGTTTRGYEPVEQRT